ncbi:hypothetical protein N657DRAFT_387402 [Parathielavia appendiculata]|uniref:RRM domain-containing protein n=1 Tax=Parathielavia appendiculata TaxID=2587402 RepID=A0AAN6Z4W3_9PEZI|nr:hypothetical protein N657DRAFT_387402 [Parathielavia appendiculata]
MPEPSPEIVAAASLSPLSPIPVSIQKNAIQTTVVPNLQDQAATADEAALHSAVPPSPSAPHHQFTMDVKAEASDISDTIVVAGDDYSDASHDESDESIDYGEGENGQEQENVEPDAANDDYAQTFDSPAAHEDQSEAEEAQPDVSMASESMNSPSAPDPAAVPSDRSSSPTPPPALPPTDGSVPAPATSSSSEQANGSEHPSETPSAAHETSPSSAAPATDSAADLPEKQNPSASNPEAAPAAAVPAAPTPTNEDDAAVDIQKLVDDITSRAAATASPSDAPPAQATPVTTQAAPAPLSVSHPPSLPPKPSLPNLPVSLPAIPPAHYSFQSRGSNGAGPAVPMTIASSGAHGPYNPNEGISSLPAAPPGPFGGPSHAHHLPRTGDSFPGAYPGSSIKQLWEQFQADEKRYTSEAKWERFPEGSRIFIGNLSSERVSKREVFDVFHRFGRLAQISLKSAYGFVQYHTVAEGQAAMQGAQGIELGGRRIHLEISRVQKKKDERDRSPDRRGPRGPYGTERYDTGERGWRRDDYRSGRSPSPRRNDSRASHYPRDRDFGTHGRRRSRSPPRFGRHGDDSYRRRSPSPHRRAPSDGDRFDLPRRFGSEVPDVQILLLQEVSRDFVGWVQGAFHNKGLKTDVMYLNPRFPRETVLQRQVVEGVHAIVDLDYAAQTKGKIPIQVFNRSGGSSVRFELYQDIDPPIAAELVMREKSQAGALHVQPPAPSYAPPAAYGPPPHHQPAGYNPYPYPQHPVPPLAQQTQPPAAASAPPDLASMVGNLDNSALQALLASLQTPQAQQASAAAGAGPQQTSYPGVILAPASVQSSAAPQQIDMNALLGNLRSAAAAAQPVSAYGAVAPAASGAAYLPGGVNGYGGVGGTGVVDPAQQVQTIMDQLKRAAH